MNHRILRSLGTAACALAATLGSAAFAQSPVADNGCITGLRAPPLDMRFDQPADTALALSVLTGTDVRPEPMERWELLLKQALLQNPGLQATDRGVRAATLDIDDVKGGRRPRVDLNAGVNSLRATTDGVTTQTATPRGALGVSISAPLYDGGRLDGLQGYREGLQQAALAGQEEAKENLALEVVLNTLERERYALQTLVYRRYENQMACLSEGIDRIVREDRGRASELVQARKSLSQARISLDETQSRVRQLEVQLRRLLGDPGALTYGLGQYFVPAPQIAQAQAFVEQSPAIRELDAQTRALQQYAQSLQAQDRTQISWVVTGSNARTVNNSTNSTNWQAGVQLSKNLYAGGSYDAAYKAAVERAEATRLQRDQAIAERLARLGELTEQATASWDRARRYAVVLRDSDQVRRNTVELWSLLGRRSLFDVMSAESEHYALRAAFVSAVFDAVEAQAQARAIGGTLRDWLQQR